MAVVTLAEMMEAGALRTPDSSLESQDVALHLLRAQWGAHH